MSFNDQTLHAKGLVILYITNFNISLILTCLVSNYTVEPQKGRAECLHHGLVFVL